MRLQSIITQISPPHTKIGKIDNNQYSSIYCLKALGAFFVISIHCYCPWFITPLFRTAVPIFFIISGFFLYRENLDDVLNKSFRTLKKLVWITLSANIFYYICFFVPYNIVPFESLKSIIGFLVVGHTFGYHLWYLNAYIQVLLVLIVAIKLKILPFLWRGIPLFIIGGLITGKYEFLFPDLPNKLVISRNFITIGIPCFGIGWLIKKYSLNLAVIGPCHFVLPMILFALSEFECIFLKYYTNKDLIGDYTIITIPLAASIFILFLKYPALGKDSLLELIGKKYSMNIYIFHIFILKILKILNNKIGFPTATFPFIVLILTMVFIVIWKKCSESLFASFGNNICRKY